MARTKSPITNQFVENRMVFWISESWEFDDDPDYSGFVVDSMHSVDYVGFGGSNITPLWHNCENHAIDDYKIEFSALKIPDDYPYNLKYEEPKSESGFETLYINKDRTLTEFVVSVDKLRDLGFEIYELEPEEKTKPFSVDTDYIKTLLEDRKDGFKIS